MEQGQIKTYNQNGWKLVAVHLYPWSINQEMPNKTILHDLHTIEFPNCCFPSVLR